MAELSFQVAHATGLDSTAMKVLAIVTVIFLPPSFIAVSPQTDFSVEGITSAKEQQMLLDLVQHVHVRLAVV